MYAAGEVGNCLAADAQLLAQILLLWSVLEQGRDPREPALGAGLQFGLQPFPFRVGDDEQAATRRFDFCESHQDVGLQPGIGESDLGECCDRVQ